jgi:hypothetical protein
MRILFLLAVIGLSTVINAQSKQALIPFLKKNGKYIYVDSATMKPVINKEFASASLFDKDGLASVNDKPFDFFVKTGSPNYIIDKTGKIAKSGSFELRSTYNDQGLAKIKTANGYGYVNKNGVAVVPAIWEETKDYFKTMIPVKSNGKWGYCDLTGRLQIPAIYEEADNFHERLAFVKLNDKWGVIDTTGKLRIPFQFKNSSWFADYNAYVTKDGVNYYNITKSGMAITTEPGDYAIEGRITNSCARLKLNNKWKLSMIGEKNADPILYDSIGYFSWTAPYLAAAVQKGKSGYINLQGKPVVPFIYDEVSQFYGAKLAAVKSGGKYGAVNLEGKLVIPVIYNGLEVLNDKFVMVSLGAKFALADHTNKILTGFNFHPLGFSGSEFPENSGLLKVSDAYSFGFFSIDGFYIDITGREYREK